VKEEKPEEKKEETKEDDNDEENEEEEEEELEEEIDEEEEENNQIAIVAKAKLYAATNKEEILKVLSIAIEGLKSTRVKVANIVNLFKGAELPAYAATKLYDYLLAADSTKFPEPDTSDPWLLYHTTKQSSSSLAQKMMSEASVIALKLLSEEDVMAIESATPQVLYHGISNRGLAVTHAYLTANHYEYGDWYQGERAKNSVLPGLYSYWLDVFTKFNKLVGNKSATDNVKTMDELADKVGYNSYVTKKDGRSEMATTHRT
jgi:hypothetical protein